MCLGIVCFIKDQHNLNVTCLANKSDSDVTCLVALAQLMVYFIRFLRSLDDVDSLHVIWRSGHQAVLQMIVRDSCM